MNPQRYIRQTMLNEFGPQSQQKLLEAKVLVVGAGGLGIPVLQYLTSMGVGTIGIVENDLIDISNLQRQVIYNEVDVGQPKLNAALNRLKDLNYEVKFLPFKTFLTPENALEIIKKFDVIVDASDNFPTRYLINDACVILNKPFIYGALHGFEGQLSVFNYNDGPTYRCIFPNKPTETEIPDCNENGVLGVIPGIIGTLQALETIKVITSLGEIASGSILIYDGLTQDFKKIKFDLNPENKKIYRLKEDYGFNNCDFNNSITVEQFIIKLNSNDDMQVLDVRSENEFKSGNVQQSINLPIDNLTKSNKSKIFENYSEFFLICQSGKRSLKAVHILKNEFPEKHFVSVIGGYNALNRKSQSSTIQTI